jgi:hypothetical protein
MHIAYNKAMKSSAIQSRLSHSQWSLKPQDLAVAFKLVSLAGQRLTYAALAKSMYLSAFEAHSCVARLTSARLITEVEGQAKIVMPAFRPLVLHGAAYFFPAVRGEITVGLPTAYGAAPLKQQLLPFNDLPPVWPCAAGTVRGTGLLPLYPNLPLAAHEDPKFYELLALFDALRIGQAREREIVANILIERLI